MQRELDVLPEISDGDDYIESSDDIELKEAKCAV
jgi:hypothetical protein